MAGEIQLNSTTFATESGGTITVANVDSATNRQNLGLEIGVDVQQFDSDTTKNDVANTFTANQIISVTDNTNAALRVTQLGTGNALVVEDETNPDSSPFVVDASGNVGVGTSTISAALHLHKTAGLPAIRLSSTASGADTFEIATGTPGVTNGGFSIKDVEENALRLVIDSSGNVLVGTTSLTVGGLTSAGNGVRFSPSGIVAQFASNDNASAIFNRTSTDGSIISLRQDGTEEGTISVSGAVVTLNGFTGTHWSRLLDGSTPDIPRGTILESLDEMMDWVKEDGTLEDDIKHVKCKISDTVESKNVYGLFFAWDNDDNYNDLNVAQEGSFVIRIHSSQDVQRGDLIQSNGDGTGKIQADDIIRSSTVAKVISNHRVETYEDGSYIVPCVIHC